MRKKVSLASALLALAMASNTNPLTTSFAEIISEEQRLSDISADRRPITSFATQSQIDQELRRLDALITDDGPSGASDIPKLVPNKEYWMPNNDNPIPIIEKLRDGIVPNLHSDPIRTPLTEKLYISKEAGVYVIDDGSYVIKYHRFCPSELEPIDSLLVEWFFLNDLDKTAFIPAITHKAIYLSASVVKDQTWPFVGKILKSDENKCDDGSLPKIRFMISERTGISVTDYLVKKGGRLDIVTAAKMGVQMIRLLQRIHETKHYIHGDVHGGNFAVSPQYPYQLILIDFGRARLVDEYMFPDGENTFMFDTRDAVQCHILWSQWQSRGRLGSFRDDVYRALTLIARSIHGNEFEVAVNGFCSAVSHYSMYRTRDFEKRQEWEDMYLNFQEKLNFFDVSRLDRFDRKASAPPRYFDFSLYSLLQGTILEEQTSLVSGCFGRALEVIRATRIQEMPQHASILEELFAIIKLDPREDQYNPSTTINFN